MQGKLTKLQKTHLAGYIKNLSGIYLKQVKEWLKVYYSEEQQKQIKNELLILQKGGY